MKTIVCFGDSNTWGSDPATGERFAPDRRWTGVLQSRLGAGCRVIEEGLNGRMTTVDDPIYPGKNGADYLLPCLESHKPLDLVTIMLGTNDLKARLGRSASDIAESAAFLAGMARRSGAGPDGGLPKVLLISPPPVTTLSDLAEMFTGAREKSLRFAEHYRVYAKWSNAEFFDAGSIVASSDLDGIHWEGSAHAAFGRALADEVERLLA
ncbi:MAG: SGNH/GDSL hydrolase family protein [Thermomicrobiales bacterium]